MGVDGAEIAQVMLFARSHARLIGGAVHVVVAAEVEDAVSQEMREFSIERVTGSIGLPRRSWQGNRDIAEECLVGHSLNEVIGLIGKREDVRGLVDAKELVVHPLDFTIVDDQYREGGPIRDVFPRQHANGEVVEGGHIHRRGRHGDFYGDVVGDGTSPFYFTAKIATASFAAEISGIGTMPNTNTPSVATLSDKPMEGVGRIAATPSSASPRNICRTTPR